MNKKVAALLFLVSVSTSALGQQASFVVAAARVDRVQGPMNLFDVSRDCANNPVCSALLEGISVYSQIPIDRAVGMAAIIARARAGEGGNMELRLPSGYAYCRSSMKMVSIVPHDGPRGSTFLGEARDSMLFMETWTPTRQPWDGNTWVEADVSVVGVRQDLASSAYADGTCNRPGRHLWYCRGGGCRDTQDRGQAIDVRPSLGAGEYR